MLDAVGDQIQRLQPKLSALDREKIDEYFTSVRELEERLKQAEAWSKKPKPHVDIKPFKDDVSNTDLIGKTQLRFDLMHLAIQTDSSRLFTLQLLGTSGAPPISGVSLGHHDLSHHGQDPTKIAQLKLLELAEMKTIRDFLDQLKQTQEEDHSLLDSTMVFFSSNLGNAADHSVRNLPVLLAGGGFRHVSISRLTRQILHHCVISL